MQRSSHTFPFILLVAYLILFVVLAFNPFDRPTWWAENVTVWIIVGALGVLYWRGIRFSNTAYLLMSVLIFLHTIGGHYTFAKVPFDWVTDFFGFERNHYDRVAHFSVGFYAYAIAEWLWSRRLVENRILLFTYPVFAIAAVAALYEIIEWIYAATTNPEAGIAYLGSQGDIWDAQKDMLADTLGALLVTILFFFMKRKDKGPILFYEHDFYIFSNFSSFALDWKGKRYITSEHAYHSEKFKDEPLKEEIRQCRSAHDALKLAHTHKNKYRSDWDEVKLSVMKEILREKVKQHPYVKKKLLDSGERELIEDSWRDDFWGWGPKKNGRNQLGKLWMEVRKEFR